MPDVLAHQGVPEIATLPKIRSFVTVQIAYYGSKHISLREGSALHSMGRRIVLLFSPKCVYYDRHKTVLWRFNDRGFSLQEDIDIFV